MKPCFFVRCVFFFFVMQHAFCVAASELRIDMRDQVVMDRKQVVLGDVANISAGDIDVLRKVMAIPIGHAPMLGQTVILERTNVQRWVSRYLSMMRQGAAWTGASHTAVSVPKQEVSGEKIVLVAKSELERWLVSQTGKSSLQLNQIPSSVWIPRGEFRMVARSLPRQTEMRSRMSVTVDIFCEQTLVRTVVVGFDVSVYQEAIVVRRDLLAGELIDDAAIELKEVLVSARSDQLLNRFDSEARLRAKTKLAKGQYLTAQLVETMPLARLGERSILVMRTGLLEVESTVEVLKEGRLGDVIPVKGMHASGAVMATVIGEGKLEIKL